MRILYRITDADVKTNVMDIIREAEEEGTLTFPNDTEREEFITNCTDTISDRIMYRDYLPTLTDYEDDILTDAASCGYLIDQ